MLLTILQVATAGNRLADRVCSRFSQVEKKPPRAAREVGLALVRGRTEISHSAGMAIGPLSHPDGTKRMEEIVVVEASRTPPLVAADEGSTILTVLLLAETPGSPASEARWGGAGLAAEIRSGDAPSLEAALRRLGELGDAEVGAFRLLRMPADATQSVATAELARVYPHLGAIDAAAVSGQQRCPFCGALFAFSGTRCPHCGADVPR